MAEVANALTSHRFRGCRWPWNAGHLLDAHIGRGWNGVQANRESERIEKVSRSGYFDARLAPLPLAGYNGLQ